MRKNKHTFFWRFILFLFYSSILIPAFTLLVWSVTERWTWPNLLPQFFSDRALQEVLGRNIELLNILASSVFISVIVTIFSVIISIMTARAMVFYQFYGKKILYFFTILPFMVPATVFAMGVQLIFIKMGLNNTMMGVMVSHLICSLPYAIQLLINGTRATGYRLEEQARVLGATSWQAFYKVALPSLMPVIVSAASMSYIVSFSQYFLTLLIGGGQVKTFTIVMVPYLQSKERNIASIYSLIFLFVTLLVFAIFEWIVKRRYRDGKSEFYA